MARRGLEDILARLAGREFARSILEARQSPDRFESLIERLGQLLEKVRGYEKRALCMFCGNILKAAADQSGNAKLYHQAAGFFSGAGPEGVFKAVECELALSSLEESPKPAISAIARLEGLERQGLRPLQRLKLHLYKAAAKTELADRIYEQTIALPALVQSAHREIQKAKALAVLCNVRARARIGVYEALVLTAMARHCRDKGYVDQAIAAMCWGANSELEARVLSAALFQAAKLSDDKTEKLTLLQRAIELLKGTKKNNDYWGRLGAMLFYTAKQVDVVSERINLANRAFSAYSKIQKPNKRTLRQLGEVKIFLAEQRYAEDKNIARYLQELSASVFWYFNQPCKGDVTLAMRLRALEAKNRFFEKVFGKWPTLSNCWDFSDNDIVKGNAIETAKQWLDVVREIQSKQKIPATRCAVYTLANRKYFVKFPAERASLRLEVEILKELGGKDVPKLIHSDILDGRRFAVLRGYGPTFAERIAWARAFDRQKIFGEYKRAISQLCEISTKLEKLLKPDWLSVRGLAGAIEVYTKKRYVRELKHSLKYLGLGHLVKPIKALVVPKLLEMQAAYSKDFYWQNLTRQTVLDFERIRKCYYLRDLATLLLSQPWPDQGQLEQLLEHYRLGAHPEIHQAQMQRDFAYALLARGIVLAATLMKKAAQHKEAARQLIAEAAITAANARTIPARYAPELAGLCSGLRLDIAVQEVRQALSDYDNAELNFVLSAVARQEGAQPSEGPACGRYVRKFCEQMSALLYRLKSLGGHTHLSTR